MIDQFHIQTDGGNDERFFKYQTHGGQFREESVLQDGSVVGTFGWIDANGFIREFTFVADNKGYRITGARVIKHGQDQQLQMIKKQPNKIKTSRLERRIDRGNGVTVVKVEPLFDTSEVVRANGPFFVPLRRRHGARRLKVVKRRRNPGAVDVRTQEGGGGARTTLDYQTPHLFHRERVSAGDGARLGEFGYIDPLGVRRVVTYVAHGSRDLAKEKENDYVGPDATFEAV